MRMYDFTEAVLAILRAARAEANRLGVEYIGTEHLLLGILASGNSKSLQLLQSIPLEPADFRAEIEAVAEHGRGTPGSQRDLPYTSRAKRVLELAMDEAARLRDGALDEEHILLGLAAEEKGIAAQSLQARGLTLEGLRETVQEMRATAPVGEKPGLHRWWDRMRGRK